LASTTLTNVYWVLGAKKYDAFDSFVAAVTDYNNLINPEKTNWAPNQEVASGPIRVVYEALWKDEDEIIELEVGEPGKPLNMGLLLFTINNATYDFFKDADKRFFEGLALCRGSEYELMVGS
jgi:hypothetical protein